MTHTIFVSRLFTICFCCLLLGNLKVSGQRASTPNIYGIHGWAGDANTLLNGKGAYSVDLIYSDSWAADANYRVSFINSMTTAYNQGFTVIVRVDYAPCHVVPPEW